MLTHGCSTHASFTPSPLPRPFMIFCVRRHGQCWAPVTRWDTSTSVPSAASKIHRDSLKGGREHRQGEAGQNPAPWLLSFPRASFQALRSAPRKCTQ